MSTSGWFSSPDRPTILAFGHRGAGGGHGESPSIAARRIRTGRGPIPRSFGWFGARRLKRGSTHATSAQAYRPPQAAEETAGKTRTTNNTASTTKPTNNRRNQKCANGGRDATNMGAPGLMARAPSAFGSPAISPKETRGFAYPPHDGAAFIGRSGLFTTRPPYRPRGSRT